MKLGKTADYSPINRESIDMSEWKMLKTLDGCGPELLAITALINELNQELDSVLNEIEDDEDMTAEINDIAEDSDEENEDEDDSFDESIFNSRMVDTLPEYTLVQKHLSQATMMKQAHDVAKNS